MSESPSDHVPGTDSRNEAATSGTPVASLTPLAQQYLDSCGSDGARRIELFPESNIGFFELIEETSAGR